jgi:hypothetical protein
VPVTILITGQTAVAVLKGRQGDRAGGTMSKFSTIISDIWGWLIRIRTSMCDPHKQDWKGVLFIVQ